MWTATAVASAVTMLLVVGIGIRSLERIAVFFSTRQSSQQSRLQKGFAELLNSGLLNARVARELTTLSLLRFLILALMAGMATRAIGVEVPLWQLAAAMPFVVFSSVIAISPGALGVSELTYASALSLFGTPLPVAAQFALANRFLVVAASFIVAISASGILFLKRAFTFSEAAHSESPIH